jgi:hypothetical protein
MEAIILHCFGEVAAESGVKDYWQLKAIDAIWIELPQKERNETIEILIDNQDQRITTRSVRPC